MVTKNKAQYREQQKLAEDLLTTESLSWEEYLQRFADTTPLKLSPASGYPWRLSPDEIESDIDLLMHLSNRSRLQRLGSNHRIIAGFKRKVSKEEVERLNVISPNFYGLSWIFHRRIIEAMQEVCPEDFEAVPVTLISTNSKVEPFEIKDFYAINALNCIDPTDYQRSIIKWSDGMAFPKRLYYKADPWQDGCKVFSENNQLQRRSFKLEKPCKLAVDALKGGVLWHPEVAKLLPYSSLYWFIRPEEQYEGKYGNKK